MASTASEIIATAKTEAEAARQSALSNLSGLSSNLQAGYDTQRQATTDYYTNMLNQLENAYSKDVKSAYATSMTDRQSLMNSLNRLGLSNSGYGVSQMLGIGSQYSKNLADLQNTLATNKATTGYQQQQTLADLYNTYITNKNALDQYMYEAGETAYNTAFANRYQAEQDAIANALQQQYYNYLMSSGGGGGSSSSSGGSSSGSSGSSATELTDETTGTTGTTTTTSSGNISIKVTDAGKSLATKLAGVLKLANGAETAKREIQYQYNEGNITAGDVNYIISKLKLS